MMAPCKIRRLDRKPTRKPSVANEEALIETNSQRARKSPMTHATLREAIDVKIFKLRNLASDWSKAKNKIEKAVNLGDAEREETMKTNGENIRKSCKEIADTIEDIFKYLQIEKENSDESVPSLFQREGNSPMAQVKDASVNLDELIALQIANLRKSTIKMLYAKRAVEKAVKNAVDLRDAKEDINTNGQKILKLCKVTPAFVLKICEYSKPKKNSDGEFVSDSDVSDVSDSDPSDLCWIPTPSKLWAEVKVEIE